MLDFKTNVVLPDWILDKQSDHDFNNQVKKYLRDKYPDYQFLEVVNGLAKCIRKDG